jgi:hypothetical protein
VNDRGQFIDAVQVVMEALKDNSVQRELSVASEKNYKRTYRPQGAY